MKNVYGFYLVAAISNKKLIWCLVIVYEMNVQLGGVISMVQSVYEEKEYKKEYKESISESSRDCWGRCELQGMR